MPFEFALKEDLANAGAVIGSASIAPPNKLIINFLLIFMRSISCLPGCISRCDFLDSRSILARPARRVNLRSDGRVRGYGCRRHRDRYRSRQPSWRIGSCKYLHSLRERERAASTLEQLAHLVHVLIQPGLRAIGGEFARRALRDKVEAFEIFVRAWIRSGESIVRIRILECAPFVVAQRPES